MRYVTRDREAGNVIDEFNSREEAEAAIAKYEAEDREQGIYEPDFYEIAEMALNKYFVHVTSECVGDSGPYNKDRFEGENTVEATDPSEAIKGEINNFRLSGQITWFSDSSAMVEVDLGNGNKKDYFFDAAEIE